MAEETEKIRAATAAQRGLPRPFKRALLSALILLVLIIAGGTVYVWFTGSNPGTPVKTVSPDAADTPSAIKPSVPGPNVPESASVETLTSPVGPGSNATINVKTLPESQCTITVTYGSVTSKDSGLGPKQADIYGTISWTWTVDSGVPSGSYPVHVVCALNSKTAVVDGTLVVSAASASS